MKMGKGENWGKEKEQKIYLSSETETQNYSPRNHTRIQASPLLSMSRLGTLFILGS